MGCAGSSPLARGTLIAANGGGSGAGLIPARAGNTYRRPPKPSRPRAHPRSRGEHWQRRIGIGIPRGSSPLARGTPDGWVQLPPGMGLIPARAGNTRNQHHRRSTVRAHPRSRGEHCWFLDRTANLSGSSPLARGTQSAPQNRGLSHGLIPARAGNTQ